MVFHIVTNILSPFRLHLYTELHNVCKSRNCELFLHFLASKKYNRFTAWDKLDSLPFKHKVWKDYPIIRGRAHIHFNPGFLLKFRVQKDDVVMIGGPWSSITGIVFSLLNRNKKNILAWLELNTQKVNSYSGVIKIFKKTILSCYSSFAVPGADGRLAVMNLLQCSSHSISILPNIVNEQLFVSKWTYDNLVDLNVFKMYKNNPETKIAFIPARLSYEKGIGNLIDAIAMIDKSVVSKWKIIIAGVGPEKNSLYNQIADKGLEDNIHIISPFKYETMPLAYASADLFILASFWDHNPLTVIEAMWVGLPVLISKNVGNFKEALEPDFTNGWGFAPENLDLMAETVRMAFLQSSDKLANMGKKSHDKAVEHWSSKIVCEQFLTNKVPMNAAK